MIALCPQHHAQADVGTFTNVQLRGFKEAAAADNVDGRFDWMRRKLLVTVGRAICWEERTILTLRNERVIWVNRDDDGYLLLNLKMPTTSDQPRLFLQDNSWVLRGKPTDFECPPNGRLIEAKYKNSDYLRVEFRELDDLEGLTLHRPNVDWTGKVEFPIVVATIRLTIGGADIQLDETGIRLGGRNVNTGIVLGTIHIR